MADALLSSLASVNSAFHWAAYFAYSSAVTLWIHSCLYHFICSSVDGSASLVLLLLLLLILPLFKASPHQHQLSLIITLFLCKEKLKNEVFVVIFD